VQINTLALKAIRERTSLTQTALAGAASIDRANYAHIEAGRRGATAAQIQAIARALAVPVGAIAIADDERVVA
jgi:transcriptional regulator with XRE-family HTH domain